MFLVELIVSSFLDLISKQARPECHCKRVLVISSSTGFVIICNVHFWKFGVICFCQHTKRRVDIKMRNLTIFITTVSVCFIFYYYHRNNEMMKTWPYNNLLWLDVMVYTIKVKRGWVQKQDTLIFVLLLLLLSKYSAAILICLVLISETFQ